MRVRYVILKYTLKDGDVEHSECLPKDYGSLEEATRAAINLLNEDDHIAYGVAQVMSAKLEPLVPCTGSKELN